jgi:hypothetical protein
MLISDTAEAVTVRLEAPSMRRAAAFVAAVLRSHALHGRWVHPPSTREQYRASGHMRAGLAAVIRLAFRSTGSIVSRPTSSRTTVARLRSSEALASSSKAFRRAT